ncbi:MAG: hypothetical protein NXI20_17815 [bacterium]|nr:hypothetical protein [bacterium]
MKLELTTGPSVEPVTVQEAADHVYTDASYDNKKLERNISACRKIAESYCERAFINQVWKMTLDGFPSKTSYNKEGAIFIPKGKIQSLTSNQISYIDSSGSSQTLTLDTDFTMDNTGDVARLIPTASLGTWPTTSTDHLNTVTVDFTAGYGTSLGDEYNGIKDAILMHLGTLYDLRQTHTTVEIFENKYWQNFLNPYKLYFNFELNDE